MPKDTAYNFGDVSEYLDDEGKLARRSLYERKLVSQLCNNLKNRYLLTTFLQQNGFEERARVQDFEADFWEMGGQAQKRWCSAWITRSKKIYYCLGSNGDLFQRSIKRDSADQEEKKLVLRSECRRRHCVGSGSSCENWNDALEKLDRRIPVSSKKKCTDCNWLIPKGWKTRCLECHMLQKQRQQRHGRDSSKRRKFRSTCPVHWTIKPIIMTPDACLPDSRRTPNDTVKQWLQAIAFLPILVTRAFFFAERFVLQKLQMKNTQSQRRLMPHVWCFSSNCKTRVGSSIDVLWSNKKPHFRYLPSRYPNVEWICSNTHGIDESGALQLYSRCPGSLCFELQRKMWQLQRISSFLSTSLVINAWAPHPLRSSKSCTPAMSAYLALGLSCGPQQSRRTFMKIWNCIFSRVFCVQRRLQMISQVSHDQKTCS
jgi:hypothetical protein